VLKNKVLLLLTVASIMWMLISVFGTLKDRKVRSLSETYIEETYGENCQKDMRATIYGKEDGYYSVALRPKEGVTPAYYLQIKLTMWWQTDEILDASEYNDLNSCKGELDV
jgi:hypothetical protein